MKVLRADKKSIGIKSDNRGVTLLMMSMLMLTAIIIVSLSVNEMVRVGLNMAKTQINSTQAFFAAEAGMERILWEVRKNQFVIQDECASGECINFDVGGDLDTSDYCDATCNNAAKLFSFSNGADYRLYYEVQGTDNVVKSYGRRQDTNRVLKVEYPMAFGCMSTCNVAPGCRIAGVLNSNDNGDTCCTPGFSCYECDPGYAFNGIACIEITCTVTCPSGAGDPGCHLADPDPGNDSTTADVCCGAGESCYVCNGGLSWDGSACN